MHFDQLPMDAQMVIAQVANHLAAQRKVCVSNRGWAAYRGEDALCDPIGFLIPDELYCPSLEMTDIEGLISDHAMISDHLLGLMPSLGDDDATEVLQACSAYHDSGSGPIRVATLGPNYTADLRDFRELDDKAFAAVIRAHICTHISLPSAGVEQEAKRA